MNDLTQLPAYSDAQLAGLGTEALIGLMIADEDRVPRNVIEECARRGNSMVERLGELLEEKKVIEKKTLGEWWLRFHAIMILGLIPSETAGLLLVKFMRRMSAEEDRNLQDWFAGRWPAMFENKPESALPALRALAEDRSMDWYIRAGARDACLAAAHMRGNGALEQALNWLAGIVADEQANWNFRLTTGNTLLDFPRARHRLLLEDMAARQSGWGVHFDQDDVQRAYAAMKDKPEWERFGDPWKFYSPGEIEARQRRWAEEDARGKTDRDEDYDLDEAYFPEPYMRTEPKIGRNDPCPCGSGKKYKKCCLNAGEARRG